MTPRPLGNTGLSVAPLGLGAGPLGDGALSEAAADALVGRALELGLTLFDTAPSYGSSEERLGRALRGRRGEVVLVTKGGYGVPGVPEWTPECIARGVDQALGRLRTEVLDVFLLHSCGPELLEPLLPPLLAAKAAGKVRAIGYSGDGPGLDRAVALGAFDVLEASVNLVDQAALRTAIPRALGAGVLAKRALANAPWDAASRPSRPDAAEYWDRFRALGLVHHLAWDELALRFAAFAPGVSCALAGTRSRAHLDRLAACVERGPLPGELQVAVTARFDAVGAGWPGVI